MSNNKVGVLRQQISLSQLLAENPQYQYSADDGVLRIAGVSWAFIVQENDTSPIYLYTEQGVSEQLILELLAKYGGEFYGSEYDRKPSSVYVAAQEMENTGRSARSLVAGRAKESFMQLDAQIGVAEGKKSQPRPVFGRGKNHNRE